MPYCSVAFDPETSGPDEGGKVSKENADGTMAPKVTTQKIWKRKRLM
jgi:hypothetical protein